MTRRASTSSTSTGGPAPTRPRPTTGATGHTRSTPSTANRQISGWFDNTDISGDGFIEIFFISAGGDGYSLGVGNAYHLYPYSGRTGGSAFTNF